MAEQADPATVESAGVAQFLATTFGVELSTASWQCASCHVVTLVQRMHVAGEVPSVELRCPSCRSIVLAIKALDDGTVVDATGLAYLIR